MNHNQVTQLLKDYRCYEYAALRCGYQNDFDRIPVIISERMGNPNKWDGDRYNRIVGIIKGAVDHVLDDDQRAVIMRKYLERNTMNLAEIAVVLHKDRTTIGRWHTEAINKLAIALEPLNYDLYEITNFDHYFDPNWQFKEPKHA
jgi:DNA-directed RNA polymerase specialized sigma subunit